MTHADEQSLKHALLQMVDHYRMRSRLTQVKVNKCWGTVMGPTIAQYTTEIKVRKTNFTSPLIPLPSSRSCPTGKKKSSAI